MLVSPKDLSLLSVVEAVIGEIFLNDCLMSADSCIRSRTCSINRVWEEARNQVRETLRDATFDKLMKDESCMMPVNDL